MQPFSLSVAGLGFGVYTDFGHASFMFFGFAMHYHPSHDENPCPFRYGLEFTLFGIHLDVGIFRT